MPDLASLLPHDTVIVRVPIDRQSLPGYIVIICYDAEARHNFAPRTNQLVLNRFRDVFGIPYWDVVVRAGLTSVSVNRTAVYSGPDVEALPLTEDEKRKLIAAM